MLSTIRRIRAERRETGQILVLFAGGLATLLIVAALAFDVGMVLVERRDEQNAADAAALAGARYVLIDQTTAEDAARTIAQANGFDDSDPDETVNVYMPAVHGRYAGLPGFIEVEIQDSRPSIFAGIIGRPSWDVSAFAVATNKQNLSFPFGMLALNPTACKAIQVSGTGVINLYNGASVQSNSNGADCTGDPIGFSRTGGSTINVFGPATTCRSAGGIQDQGSGAMTCTKAPDSFALPDPLRNLPAPPKPALAGAMAPVGFTRTTDTYPNYCPGKTGTKPPSETQPNPCVLGLGSDAGLAWILQPGLYPNGLVVKNGATAYLRPGIYWIGGGGIQVGGSSSSDTSSIISIPAGFDPTGGITHASWETDGGDVLIYNSKLPGIADGPITFNGSAGRAWLKPFQVADSIPDSCDDLSCYNNIVIFQDRTVTQTVTLNGSTSETDVEGLIYVPAGEVKLNGNSGTLNVDQIIADTFLINGNGGTINVNKGTDFESDIIAAGLVD
ncbi:MAG TPA: pilus assembly protein TadG-related protein [Candidatus Limnocylindrales bacterium]|nr:pilus assembly protein TadG-related protein [Candidatus Limnocylindrales bacterium]